MQDLSIYDLAAQMKIHPDTLRREIIRGRLGGYKAGSKWRFTQEDVDRYKKLRSVSPKKTAA